MNYKDYLDTVLSEDRKSFMKLLNQLKKIENQKDLDVWYAALNNKKVEQNKLWNSLTDQEKKLIIKNVNHKQEKIGKNIYK